MERLKTMKEMLVTCIEGQMTHLDSVDTKELGEAIDMVKDLSEAIYYCTITEAMKKSEDEESRHYRDAYVSGRRDIDKYGGRMYFDETRYIPMEGGMMYYGDSHSNNHDNGSSSNGGNNRSSNGTRGFTEREFPMSMHDEREGRSYMSRKSYIESKEMHHDKNVKLKELEKYMQELTQDMVEMIQGASPEEKQLLEKKISTLATKVSQVNG